jgi:hypothetical protein
VLTKKTNLALVLGGVLIVGAHLQAEEAKPADPSPDILSLLRTAGCVSYAHKDAYGKGIDTLTLGYGKDDKPLLGVAARMTKTYKAANALVAVTPKDGAFAVSVARIPDVETFHGKSLTLTKDALKDISSKSFKNEKEARGLVDAVTGATQYYKAIYVSYALMTSKVIEEMTNNPAWPRTTLQP